METCRSFLIRKYDPSWTFLPIDSVDTFSPPSGGKQTPNVNHSFLTELMYCRRQRARGQSHRETEKTAGRLTNKITETLTPRKLWMYPRTLSHSHSHVKTGRENEEPIRSFGPLLGTKLTLILRARVSCLQSRELHWTMMNTADGFSPESFGLRSKNERKLVESDPICWFNKSLFFAC